MRCALVSTALAATFAIGSCQFQFLHRRQGQEDGAQRSSFFSQTSWSFGQDGEFHKQTRTSSTEANQDGSMMKKRIVCKDGHCAEVVEVFEQPPPPPLEFQEIEFSPEVIVIDGEAPPMPCPGAHHPYHDMQSPPALRGMLNRLIGNMEYQLQPQQPPLVVEPMRNMQLPSRFRTMLDRLTKNMQFQRSHEPQEVIFDTRGNGQEAFLEAPRSVSSPRWIEVDVPRAPPTAPAPRWIEIDVPRAPPTAPAPVQSADMTFVKAGVAIVALGAAYALVMSALNCYRVDQISARERPLREFAEPLAPDSVNVAIPGAATRKADPVRMYLSNLYTRANAKNEARGVTTYLARLYARILV